MSKKTIGLFAHVDAGKTTFAEQLLYHTQSIRERGRVDHKDAFLDSHDIERQRGITVFADHMTSSLFFAYPLIGSTIVLFVVPRALILVVSLTFLHHIEKDLPLHNIASIEFVAVG